MLPICIKAFHHPLSFTAQEMKSSIKGLVTFTEEIFKVEKYKNSGKENKNYGC